MGNHDVLWIGAYAGSKVCLANLLRICARYDNLDIIEDAYGINLRPLLTLAETYYDGNNPAFKPKNGRIKSCFNETRRRSNNKNTSSDCHNPIQIRNTYY